MTFYETASRPAREYSRAGRPSLRLLTAAGAVIALATGCGAAAGGGGNSDGEPTESDVNTWLDGLVPAALETAGIAGAAVSVVHDGEILTSRGYGDSDTGVARFMLTHLDAGGDDDSSVLSQETLDLMHAPALGEDTLGGLAEGPRMTLGFFEEDRNGHRIIGHGGDTDFFHTHTQIYPEEGTGIFVGFNSSGYEKTSTLHLREALSSPGCGARSKGSGF